MKLKLAVAGALYLALTGVPRGAQARELAILYTSDIRGTLGICG
jgi:hypothetical protein